MAIDIKNIANIIKLDKILKLPRLHKLLILIGVNLVIGLVSYQFFISPQLYKIEELKDKMDQLEIKLKEAKRIAQDIPKYRKEKQELEKRLKEALERLPDKKEIPGLIESISESGKKAGLKILLFKPLPEKPKGFYAEVPVSMEVEGTFESLFDFCYRISKLSRIVNITGVNVGLTKGGTPLAPMLRAKFVVTTFRFMPEKKSPKANKKKKR